MKPLICGGPRRAEHGPAAGINHGHQARPRVPEGDTGGGSPRARDRKTRKEGDGFSHSFT